jgi:hypothetical protein
MARTKGLFIWGFLGGVGGAALGAVVGGAIGYLLHLAMDCGSSDDAWCLIVFFLFGLIGLLIAEAVFMSLGIHLANRPPRGNFLWVLLAAGVIEGAVAAAVMVIWYLLAVMDQGWFEVLILFSLFFLLQLWACVKLEQRTSRQK